MADTKCCTFTSIIFMKETLFHMAFGQSADWPISLCVVYKFSFPSSLILCLGLISILLLPLDILLL